MKAKSKYCPHRKCGVRMLRAYVRPVTLSGKQRLKAIGWWCPDCHTFTEDKKE